MKRIVLITGLLLCAFPAHAACPETSFAQALVGQTPIGEYAQAVVERATDGITRAKQQPASGSIFDLLVTDWIAMVSSALLSLVDTRIEVVNRASSLEQMTSCLHIDIAIIQAKMEEARCELNEAITTKKGGAILRLKLLLVFLQKRVHHLQEGALDPEYQDGGWQTWYPFDAPFMGWCCIQGDDSCRELESIECLEAPGNFYPELGECLTETTCFDIGDSFDAPDTPHYDEACPFDSDYLAPNTSGYGCHPNKLETYANSIGLDADEDGAVADYEALNDLNEKRDEFIEDVGHIKDITLALQQFMGEPSDPRLNDFGNTTTDNIEYKKVSGCDADVPADDTEAPPSASWSALSLRSNFSFRRNNLGIWQAFVRLMYRYAEDREFADRIKTPIEHWTEQERQDAAEEDNIFLWIIRDQLRPSIRSFIFRQTTLESAVYPKMVDTPQQVIEVLTPVRAAVRNATKLTKKPGETVAQGKSLRTFVRDLAYYLRRSCLERPCQQQLNSVLKIIFQDDCFPYAAGNFSADEDALQKCKSATGL